MFDSMKTAAIGHKLVHKDPRVMTVSEIFKIATINGARALNLMSGKLRRENWQI